MKTAFFQRITSLLILILACSGFVWAQESQTSGTATVDQEKKEQDAKLKAKKDADEAKRRDRLGMFSEVRNNATLSFGISEAYDSDVFGTINARQGDSYTLLYPRFFANVERATVQLTFNYAGGYRFYNKFTDLNTAMHNGGIEFRYQPSTRSVFFVADRMSYFPLDIQVAGGQVLLPGTGSEVPPPVVLFNNKPVFRNMFEGYWNYLLSGQTSIRLSGTYSPIRYPDLPRQDSDGYTAGFELNHRLTPKFAFTTEYNFLYSRFDNIFSSLSTHRTGIGFTYDVRPSFSVFASGGPEMTTNLGVSRVDFYARGGVRRTAQAATFTVQYEQSVQNYSGLAAPLASQSVGFDISRSFAGRFVVGAGGLYFWSHALGTSADSLNGLQVGPRMIYKVKPNMSFTVNYSYIKQTGSSLALALGPPSLSRHLVNFGFEYRLPPLLRR
ncbi:MAG: hypothetical protein LAO31_20055 [Acidobacteriia bacterium]|nr:hypothetical protein [Terriglobia bacterium]